MKNVSANVLHGAVILDVLLAVAVIVGSFYAMDLRGAVKNLSAQTDALQAKVVSLQQANGTQSRQDASGKVSQTSLAATGTLPLFRSFDQDYASATENRARVGLKPGSYFLSDYGSSVALVQRAATGTYRIVVDDVVRAGLEDGIIDDPAHPNTYTTIFEPRSETNLLMMTIQSGAFGHEGAETFPFHLETDTFAGQSNLVLGDGISPNEDAMLGLSTSQAEADHMETSGLDGKTTEFGYLPKGYSYTQNLMLPNSMAEGEFPVGQMKFVSESTVEAQIFSESDPLCDVNVPSCTPRKPVKTIRVKIDQQQAVLYGSLESDPE